MIQPVSEQDAPEEVKKNYKLLKEAFSLSVLPAYFSFIGAFPDYLSFITDQIVSNVQNEKFNVIVEEISDEISWKINRTFPPSDEIVQWISNNHYSPEFYNFQQDAHIIYVSNVKLALIFIALREAVKGWAVGAKKLSDTNPVNKSTPTESDFIDDFSTEFVAHDSSRELTQTSESLTQSYNALVRDLLPEFLRLCQREFREIMKTEKYLQIRIEAEQLILNNLTQLPDLIFSPINIVLQYTSKYPNFRDLLYLLCEHFPTYAVQRVLFSAYLLKDS